MLDKVELLVACGRPEIFADDRQRLSLLVAILANHSDAGLFAEGWMLTPTLSGAPKTLNAPEVCRAVKKQ